jgi:hypothetical protein
MAARDPLVEPSWLAPYSGTPVSVSVSPTAGWFSWDVTSMAQDNTGGLFSVALLGTGSGKSFGSSEYSPIARRVYLEIAPLPEPSEWAMLLAGLAVVGFIAKRRRNKA